MQFRKPGVLVALAIALATLFVFTPAAHAGKGAVIEQQTVGAEYSLSSAQVSGLVVDSALSYEQALGDAVVPPEGREIHARMKPHLRVVPVIYWGYERPARVHLGQIVVHKALVEDTHRVFLRMFQLRFPVKSVIPQSVFGYNDQWSMAANNSSNYRPEPGSEHRKGSAFDLNPFQNPFDITGFDPTVPVQPAGATYDPSVPGTLTMDGPVRRYWASLNWEWGGNWGNPNADPPTDFFRPGFFDYQHFQLNFRRYDAFEALLPPGV